MSARDAGISFPLFGDAVWNVPSAISIGGFSIYLYGIIVALGFCLGWLYAHRRRRLFGLSPENVMDLLLIGVAAGLIGARLFYVAFNPARYFGENGDWLNIFRIRDGGLAVYGGIIMVVAALVLYTRRKKIKLAAMLDLAAPALMIGQFIGRWGNFTNREAYGYETAAPWRMGLHFPGETLYVHPAFLYESLWNVLGFVLLHIYSKRRKFDGEIFLMYIGWYGLGRFFIEGLRGDSLMLGSLRVSQLIAGACVLVSIALLTVRYIKMRKSPVAVSDNGDDS